MNLHEMDVLQYLLLNSAEDQRTIARETELSLGMVNQSLHTLTGKDLISSAYQPTEEARDLAKTWRPERAVILAAGCGTRMLPVNKDLPIGLVEIGGEPVIERTVRQLQEAGIREIYIVTGYMKEHYEYLTDAFGVTQLVAEDYSEKNNLYSLAVAKDHLRNAYIVPVDIYFGKNPFRETEFYSWYMLSREMLEEGEIRATRSLAIENVKPGKPGNKIIGLAYFTAETGAAVRERLIELTSEGRNSSAFWEAAVSTKKGMTIPARLVNPEDATEINTYKQVLEMDFASRHLYPLVTDTIRKVFNAEESEIQNIRPADKGLSNRSFLFDLRGERYIVRIPGEGTEDLVDRAFECRVYEMLRGHGICSDNIYFDPKSGVKIARFIEGARSCNDNDPAEISHCMKILRRFHELRLKAGVDINIMGSIDYYEQLWEGQPSRYRDYEDLKRRIVNMQPFVDANREEAVLVHGDCNPDNFLTYAGGEKIDLIDWEYAGMNDPLVDVAAYIVYHLREDPKAYADMVLDAYYPEGCTREKRLTLYCYAAMWALFNSDWCEIKLRLGVELGNFPLASYRNAKAYARIFEEEIGKDSE